MSNFTIQSYVNQLPYNVATKAAQGALITGVISWAFGSTLPVALLGGAIAATATIIEAAVRPLIKNIFPNNPFIARCAQIIIPPTIALSLATSATPWIRLTYKTSFYIIPLLGWIALNEDFLTQQNVAMAWVL
ncbi:MAG: hypothetical protein Q8L98_01155 [Chlamydiales bacterium]|nr:hypothetical protein [Chlamydiales bacterium]